MPTRRVDRLDVHVTPHEKKAAFDMASQRGISMSAFVRALLGAALRAEREREALQRSVYPDRTTSP